MVWIIEDWQSCITDYKGWYGLCQTCCAIYYKGWYGLWGRLVELYNRSYWMVWIMQAGRAIDYKGCYGLCQTGRAKEQIIKDGMDYGRLVELYKYRLYWMVWMMVGW